MTGAVFLTLPKPPSANRMFQRAITKRGKRRLTPEYLAWRDSAGWLARMQLVGVPRIDCRFNVRIEVPISRRDTDNFVKPLLDLCQLVGAISNDGNAHKVEVEPVQREDCMLALSPLPEMGGVRAPARAISGRGARPAPARRGGITAADLVGVG